MTLRQSCYGLRNALRAIRLPSLTIIVINSSSESFIVLSLHTIVCPTSETRFEAGVLKICRHVAIIGWLCLCLTCNDQCSICSSLLLGCHGLKCTLSICGLNSSNGLVSGITCLTSFIIAVGSIENALCLCIVGYASFGSRNLCLQCLNGSLVRFSISRT